MQLATKCQNQVSVTAEMLMYSELEAEKQYNNNNNNFISIALLFYVQGALQSCKQHY